LNLDPDSLLFGMMIGAAAMAFIAYQRTKWLDNLLYGRPKGVTRSLGVLLLCALTLGASGCTSASGRRGGNPVVGLVSHRSSNFPIFEHASLTVYNNTDTSVDLVLDGDEDGGVTIPPQASPSFAAPRNWSGENREHFLTVRPSPGGRGMRGEQERFNVAADHPSNIGFVVEQDHDGKRLRVRQQ
jgi:hypothetical protein